MENLEEAIHEYMKKRYISYFELQELDNGLYAPPLDDVCPLCEDAQWSCFTGAHLKTEEHIALKHGVPVKMLLRATSDLAYKASDVAWKMLRYIPNSYLRSYHGNDFVWLPDEAVEAYCPVCTEGPELDCYCGIYFFWSPYRAAEWNTHADDYIVVRCKIGGAIVEADHGCRAQFARIEAIWSNGGCPRAAAAAEMYNVPLVPLFDIGELGEYYYA